MHNTSILLVEDHQILRESLRKSLEKKHYKVVGEASDGKEAILKANELKPDLIIMDISLPKLNGIEATKQIKSQHPDIKILVLTAYDYEEYIFPILEAGAAGYLLKDLSIDELIQSIETICLGESVLHPSITRRMLEGAKQSKLPDPVKSNSSSLTPKEILILKMTAKGMSNVDMAGKFHLSTRTVESHLNSIFNKMGVESRTAAVSLALTQGLLTVEDLC